MDQSGHEGGITRIKMKAIYAYQITEDEAGC